MKEINLLNIKSIDIFFDDDKFENVVETLEFYADERNIKNHTYKINRDYQMKIILNRKSKSDIAVILTVNPEKYKNITGYKRIYINQNLFTNVEK